MAKKPAILWVILILIAFAAFALFSQVANAQGIIDGVIEDGSLTAAQKIAALIVAGVFGWLLAIVNRRAVPAAAKTEEERTLMDRLALEAKKRIEALEREQFQQFLTNFLAPHMADILKAGVDMTPVGKADAYVTEALQKWADRNPELASKWKLRPDQMRDFIAAQIARAAGVPVDPLAAALNNAIGAPIATPVRS